MSWFVEALGCVNFFEVLQRNKNLRNSMNEGGNTFTVSSETLSNLAL